MKHRQFAIGLQQGVLGLETGMRIGTLMNRRPHACACATSDTVETITAQDRGEYLHEVPAEPARGLTFRALASRTSF